MKKTNQSLKTAELGEGKKSKKTHKSISSSSSSSKSSSSEYEKHPKLVKPSVKEKLRSDAALTNQSPFRNIATKKNEAVGLISYENQNNGGKREGHTYPERQRGKPDSQCSPNQALQNQHIYTADNSEPQKKDVKSVWGR